jgi:hypothetical protein
MTPQKRKVIGSQAFISKQSQLGEVGEVVSVYRYVKATAIDPHSET